MSQKHIDLRHKLGKLESFENRELGKLRESANK